MVDQDNELEAMECVLNDTSVEPIMLSYAFLRNVTNNFSEKIGSGGFGTVYMVCKSFHVPLAEAKPFAYMYW